MCGIVGLFAKRPNIKNTLGEHISDMLEVMSDRGPDSAGVSIFKARNPKKIKLTLHSTEPDLDFINLKKYLASKKIFDLYDVTVGALITTQIPNTGNPKRGASLFLFISLKLSDSVEK